MQLWPSDRCPLHIFQWCISCDKVVEPPFFPCTLPSMLWKNGPLVELLCSAIFSACSSSSSSSSSCSSPSWFSKVSSLGVENKTLRLNNHLDNKAMLHVYESCGTSCLQNKVLIRWRQIHKNKSIFIFWNMVSLVAICETRTSPSSSCWGPVRPLAASARRLKDSAITARVLRPCNGCKPLRVVEGLKAIKHDKIMFDRIAVECK